MPRSAYLAVFLILALGLATPPALFAQDPPLGVLNEIGVEQRLGGVLPLDAVFRDHTGREVRLGQYFNGKPVVIVPVYYECPMLCSLILDGLTRALRALSFTPGNEFDIVTFSFDPNETPETAARKRAAYLKELNRPGAERGWHFLSGDAVSIQALTAALGYEYVYDDATAQWAHGGAIVVATGAGVISQYWYGVEFAPRDLRLSLMTASDNRIGSLIDRIFLYCYHYDPITGKYGFAIMTVLRLGGLATAMALAGFIISGVRRDRRIAAAR